jgi:pimeloyl-ACP methyl ester carboxylesterase
MGYVDAHGVTVAYRRVGRGPLVVLVHSAGDDGRIWQPQTEQLADELTLVSWDEPGAGRSDDLPAGFGLSDFADALAVIIRTVDLGPAHVAGLSWGGTIVLELYRRHPELVATLILIDTYAGWKGSLPPDEVDARVAATRRMLSEAAGDSGPAMQGMFAGDPPAQFVSLLADMAADARPVTLERELPLMAEADLSEVLPSIEVPTLLIWGEADARSPLTVARQFHDAIPGAELQVIEGAGHLSTLERPERVNDAVRAFCRAHSAE